ncbi:phosphoglycerate dehydrogenase [Rothia sp. P7208]|uniref:phosphoglycerate dehydrogenase n=1 Tax=Rothia sp. P7208 TaxID=3402660 RepID=UPI003AC89C8B
MKILAPTIIPLDAQKLGLQAEDTLVSYDPTELLPAEHYDADVMISWGNTNEQLQDAAKNLSQVKLVQALLAGPDQARAAGFRDEAVICSGIGLHSLTVAEHALALTLNFVRFLPLLSEEQDNSRWAGELGGPQELHPADKVTTLLGARVLIWGFGSIGQSTARLFQAFGAQVQGVARSAGERAGFPVIAVDDIEQYLPQTDILVMILPAAAETENALNEQRLELLPSRAFVVNVGRGVTVDEDALIAALESGSIAGAAVDVVKQEPLPSDSPLWGTKNLVITPHSAGGRPVNPEELIAHNLCAVRAEVSGETADYRNKM